MYLLEPSPNTAWALAGIQACQLVCLTILLLIFNDFIMRALGKDFNKEDSLEVIRLKNELVKCYEQQQLLSSLLVQVCDTQHSVSQTKAPDPPQAKDQAYIAEDQLPFFRNYNPRDTRKHLYYPQSVWFCGFDEYFGISFRDDISAETEASLKDEIYVFDQSQDFSSSASSVYPNSDDDYYCHEA
ncbi:hypothetical protein CJU89_2215 [Yarrowia sp. B02]|nr:hypothetical protein CJU89_2215 [Yarrowia sp. B02]